MTQKTNPWTFDVRVRDRNLKAGAIDGEAAGPAAPAEPAADDASTPE